jgi:hypothetical protein
MSNPILTPIKERQLQGVLTQTGYILESIRVLRLKNPMGIDRQWLADELGTTYTALTKNLHILKVRGLLDEFDDIHF